MAKKDKSKAVKPTEPIEPKTIAPKEVKKLRREEWIMHGTGSLPGNTYNGPSGRVYIVSQGRPFVVLGDADIEYFEKKDPSMWKKVK